MKRLDGRVALITGGSKGLGRAIALAYAREGASLAICARGAEALEAAADEARALGADVLAIVADVGSDRDRERVVSETLDRFGRVDILINNASTLGPTPLPQLTDLDPRAFEDVVRVNLVAPFILTRSIAGQMLMRGSGLIVNITSDAAVNGYSGWGAYSAAKAGLDGLTRVWAEELSPSGVTMVSVDPGDMDTEMHRAAMPDADPAELKRPGDVAEAFVELALAPPKAPRIEAAQIPRMRS